jgi:hypothetical protein
MQRVMTPLAKIAIFGRPPQICAQSGFKTGDEEQTVSPFDPRVIATYRLRESRLGTGEAYRIVISAITASPWSLHQCCPAKSRSA